MKYYLNMFVLALLLTFFLTTFTNGDSTADLMAKCSNDFTKVAACLGYATGKSEVPTKDCCGSVEDIKSREPVCLCFLMEQTLNGSDTIKGMGVHADRLLMLPSACKLTNASVSFCPELLHIPANSPEYKIFTNASSSPSSSTSPTTNAQGASLPITNSKSDGPMFEPKISSPVTIMVAIFLYFSWA